MNLINQTLAQYQKSIRYRKGLGGFVDNQDNPRFLYQFNNVVAYKAALAYNLMAEGIPIIYYGTEQLFNGGNDPQNREVMWPTEYAVTNNLYSWLRTVVQYRKKAQVSVYPQIQRYGPDNEFYAFTRGDSFVALTNQQKQDIERTITDHPYSNGTKLCNLFFSTDCVVVQNGTFPVYLNNGETKIFYPVS